VVWFRVSRSREVESKTIRGRFVTVTQIWNNGKIPVLWLTQSGLLVRLPYNPANMDILRGDRTRKPKWEPDKKRWSVPRAWLNDLVVLLRSRFGEVYLIQRWSTTEICAPACRNAKGLECKCNCMGSNHGAGGSGDVTLSEALDVSHESGWYCRLFKRTLSSERP
jgi:hypothetical protein